VASTGDEAAARPTKDDLSAYKEAAKRPTKDDLSAYKEATKRPTKDDLSEAASCPDVEPTATSVLEGMHTKKKKKLAP
jgi:hypothetical protein